MAGYKVSGTVSPGYEPVKALFEEHFRKGWEEHAQVKNTGIFNWKTLSIQVCAYVNGSKVVDLWGVADHAPNKDNFGPDSITVVKSNTKSMTALVVALLVDRGYLNYSDLVWQHWPEYGKEGKALTRISDVLRHEFGMPVLTEPYDVQDTITENIKKNAMGSHIEKQRPYFSIDDGTIRAYHAYSIGN